MTELFTVCTEHECRCLFRPGPNDYVPICPRCHAASAITGRDNSTGEVFWTYEQSVSYTPEVQ